MPTMPLSVLMCIDKIFALVNKLKKCDKTNKVSSLHSGCTTPNTRTVMHVKMITLLRPTCIANLLLYKGLKDCPWHLQNAGFITAATIRKEVQHLQHRRHGTASLTYELWAGTAVLFGMLVFARSMCSHKCTCTAVTS